MKQYIQTTAVSVIFIFASFLIAPILSPYIKSLGYSPFQISLIFALFPLAVIFITPLIGIISDHVGRRSIIRFGMVIQMCSFMLYVYGTQHIMLLMIARILNAVALTTVTLIGASKIHDLLDNSTRGKYSGIFLSFQRVGTIVAPLIGGVLAEVFAPELPFLVAIIMIATLLLFLFPHARNKKLEFSKYHLNSLSEIKYFLKTKRLPGMAAIGSVMAANHTLFIAFFPIFVTENFSMGYEAVGYGCFAYYLGHVFQFYFGAIADRIGRKKVLLTGTSIVGLSWFFVPFINSLWLLLLVLGIGGMGLGMWNVGALSILSDIGEQKKREGRIMTTYAAFSKMGSFTGFIVWGLITNFLELKYLFILGSCLVFIGSFMIRRWI
ncbi:MAG: MFS transporter [Candidatus Woesearchaeota archaeon]